MRPGGPPCTSTERPASDDGRICVLWPCARPDHSCVSGDRGRWGFCLFNKRRRGGGPRPWRRRAAPDRVLVLGTGTCTTATATEAIFYGSLPGPSTRASTQSPLYPGPPARRPTSGSGERGGLHGHGQTLPVPPRPAAGMSSSPWSQQRGLPPIAREVAPRPALHLGRLRRSTATTRWANLRGGRRGLLGHVGDHAAPWAAELEVPACWSAWRVAIRSVRCRGPVGWRPLGRDLGRGGGRSTRPIAAGRSRTWKRLGRFLARARRRSSRGQAGQLVPDLRHQLLRHAREPCRGPRPTGTPFQALAEGDHAGGLDHGHAPARGNSSKGPPCSRPGGIVALALAWTPELVVSGLASATIDHFGLSHLGPPPRLGSLKSPRRRQWAWATARLLLQLT